METGSAVVSTMWKLIQFELVEMQKIMPTKRWSVHPSVGIIRCTLFRCLGDKSVSEASSFYLLKHCVGVGFDGERSDLHTVECLGRCFRLCRRVLVTVHLTIPGAFGFHRVALVGGTLELRE